MMILAQEKQERITHINTIGWNYLQIRMYSYFNATVFSRTIFSNNGIKLKSDENAGIKSNLISGGIFMLVPSSKKCAKSLCFRAPFFEDGTKVKILSEIKPTLHQNYKNIL